MSLDPDALLDRRRLKRRLTFWRTLAVVVAIVLVAVAFRDQVRGLTGKPHIARFSVSGIITDDLRRVTALSRIAENGDANMRGELLDVLQRIRTRLHYPS